MLETLRRPRWAIGLVVVILAAIGFAAAGLWQLDRLEQRRARNAAIARGLAAEPTQLSPQAEEFTSVHASGRWTLEEYLVPLRTRDGRSGSHVLSLIEVDGDRYVVDRGWVPIDESGAYPSATGDTTLTALVRTPESGQVTGAFEGARPLISRRDPAAIQSDIGRPVVPLVLELVAASPQAEPAPLPPSPPEITEGNHLLYAIQWFSFIAIVVVGYAALLWKQSRSGGQAIEDNSAR